MRPYTYSDGTYTFSNIGDRQTAQQDIDKRVDALQKTWSRYSDEDKASHKETYVKKMRAIAEEKNRLAQDYGHTWRYKYDGRSDAIIAERLKAAHLTKLAQFFA